jgi:hypothetical protein
MAAVISTVVISLLRRGRRRWGPAPARQASANDAADFYSPSMMAMPSSGNAPASAESGSINCAGGNFDGGGASADSSGSSGDSSSCDSFDSGGSFSD